MYYIYLYVLCIGVGTHLHNFLRVLLCNVGYSGYTYIKIVCLRQRYYRAYHRSSHSPTSFAEITKMVQEFCHISNLSNQLIAIANYACFLYCMYSDT